MTGRKRRPSSTARLRLFVAAYPPPQVRRRLLELERNLDLPDDRRQTPEDQVHITLQFIGDRPARELDSIVESIDRSRQGLRAFELTPLRLIGLPEPPTPPRLIAAETDAPNDMLELQRRLARRFARRGRTQPGDRFRPHLTLCRLAPGSPADIGASGDGVIDDPASANFFSPIELEPDDPGRFVVDSIQLMKSVLSPRGATHEIVASIPLAPHAALGSGNEPQP